MKVSYTWLKDYVDVKTEPKKLAHLLTMAGVNTTSCKNVGGDYIFEFEIMANRPDCLSVLGIAREVATLLEKRLKIPKDLKTGKPANRQTGKPSFEITVRDPDLCIRYTARVIRDIEVRPSPDWLKERIISIGLRPVNNIVDITNFVLLETGQPMHAFDFDKIKGNLCVRRSDKDEKIITIDNVPRTLSEDVLVIADQGGPVAIAGLMGGIATEVNNMTKDILLESAYFDPISIRRTSRALGLVSESSYRFERRIDNDMVIRASNRASSLIATIAGGKIGAFFDIGKKTSYSKTINFDLGKANSILGVSIGKKKAIKILNALGFTVYPDRNKISKGIKLMVPSFREDVKSEIDLTEEVARIYGYEKMPLTIPRTIGNTEIKDSISLFQERITEILAGLGLNQIITYSLINRNSIKELGVREDEVVHIKNPLSIDQEILRPTLLPGMLRIISYNLNRKARRLSLFEIGKVYEEKEKSYSEEPVLSIALAGVKWENWKNQSEELDFFDIKGIFGKLLELLGLSDVIFRKEKITFLDEDIVSAVEYDGEIVGYLGQADKSVSERFDIKKKVFYGELYIGKLIKKASLEKRYTPFSQYPSVIRDISIILQNDITSDEVTGIIKEFGKKLVKDISLIDYYRGKEIPQDKRGLLYRIEYRSDKKTLEDAEVDRFHSEIKTALSKKLNVSFR